MKKLLAAAAAGAALTGFGTVGAGTSPSAVALTTGGARVHATLISSSGVEPDSLWDTPIPTTWPVDPASATEVANFAASIPTFYGSVTLNQMPVFTVPATQPAVPITANPWAGTAFLSQIGGSAPIPAGAYTTSKTYSGDSDIIISQPSTDSVWELWQARYNGNGTWSASWGGKLAPSTSTGVFPFPYGLAASGISYFGTMLTEADVASGAINHTLALSVPLCNWWTYPANRGDCAVISGHFSEGAFVKFPTSVATPTGLTPLAQMTFKALQSYGAVVADYAGSNAIQGESRADWSFTGHSGVDPITAASNSKPSYAVFNGIPWSKLVVVDPAP